MQALAYTTLVLFIVFLLSASPEKVVAELKKTSIDFVEVLGAPSHFLSGSY